MELIADRFMVLDRAFAIDLATGHNVVLNTSRTSGEAGAARWAVRCDHLTRLRHHSMADLVDYGPLGQTRRFEAWRCTGPWAGGSAIAERAAAIGRTFLGACGLTATLNRGLVHDWRGRAVWIPDGSSGYETAAAACGQKAHDLDVCGLKLVPRQAVDTVADFLADPGRHHPRAIALRTSPGAGVTTAIGDLARIARLNGYVPLCLAWARGSILGRLEGRTLLLIGTDDAAMAWRALVECSVRSPRPHRLLMATADRVDSLPVARLEAIPVDALVGAIRPAIVPSHITNRVARAALQARGRPAVFARLLWGLPVETRETKARSKAAEGLSHYAVDDVSRMSHAPSRPEPWSSSSDLSAQRERMLKAVGMLESGRHAPGERALRRAIGGLSRRGDWQEATRGALVLSKFLLKRGRPAAARGSLETAQAYAARVTTRGPTLDLGIVKGRVAFELGQLDEAECVLRAVADAARAQRDLARSALARLELARCLFWRGRYREAHDVLSAVTPDDHTVDVSVRIMALTSRIAVSRQDLSTAVSSALEAVGTSGQSASSTVVAHAWYTAAFAHLSVGDSVAVQEDVAAAVMAARRAHDPLVAFRARLLLAESDRRRGHTATAGSLLARMNRLRASTVPHTIRARCALLSDLIAAKVPTALTVARLMSATGLNALALFAPQALSSRDAVIRDSVNDVLGILRVCHDPESDRPMLTQLAATVREQLGATSVAFFGASRADCRLLSRDGGRPGALGESMARRTVTAGQLIAPHVYADAVQGGAPIRYGGDTLGALVARWPTGAQLDRPRLTLVMATAAAAAGPRVAETLTHGAAPAVAGELVGVSSAMDDVRKAVERAAASPFSVLVVGESGSGKELAARAIHRLSSRRARPFHTINCAALPDDLIESELFGHARGAFTGAVSDRPGVFEEAHTGTLFLDEVGELSLRAQAKVLRTIQEGELRRVGENVPRRIDVRLVSATNRDLPAEAGAGRFRMDLLYRLDVVRIALPPLRERREDVVLLVERCWREATLRVGSRATLAGSTVAALSAYAWPGNVRELQNVLAALAVRVPKRGAVHPSALPPQFAATAGKEGIRLGEARRIFEERFVRAALVRTGGHRTRAASELGVSRQGLAKLMSRLGIDQPRVTQ